MISKEYRECPVCKSKNSLLTVTCDACGAYIQDRVPTLNLFETAWGLFEAPKSTMKRILIAEHKNYVVLLQSLFGCAFTYFVFWFLKIGTFIDNLSFILLLGIILGPFVGVVLINILSIIARIFISHLKHGTFRNVRALLSYATVPIIVSVLVVFPIEVGIFGLYLFTGNPSPFLIKPTIYSLLLIMDGLLILWSVALCVIGFNEIVLNYWRSIFITIFVICVLLIPVLIVNVIVI